MSVVNKEEWLNKNTFLCSLGRVSVKQCESLRKRPKLGEKVPIYDPKLYNIYMPKVCENCVEWKNFIKSEDAKMKEGFAGNKVNKKEIVLCKECGKKFVPYLNGKNVIRRFCPDCLKVKMEKGLLNYRAKKDPKKLLFSVNFTGYPNLFEQLKKAARNNIRLPEQQALAYIIQGLERDKFEVFIERDPEE